MRDVGDSAMPFVEFALIIGCLIFQIKMKGWTNSMVFVSNMRSQL